MDVKLFSLCKQDSPEAVAGMKSILKCVKAFFPECEGFNNFTSQKRMLFSVAQTLQAADIVVVAVQSNMYNATKRLLSNTFDIKMAKNRAITAALTPAFEAGTIKQSVFDANIRFPTGAVIMPTDDYINCGFVLSAGGQHIVYLPLESQRADEVVYGSLFDFFREIGEENTENAFAKRHPLIIKRTADKLRDDSINVAFAGNDAVSIITMLSAGFKCEGFVSSDVSVSEYFSKQELINLARDVRNEKKTYLGVAFSPVKADENDERFISVAIADINGTTTFDFSAQSDEADDELLLNCIDKVMLLLYSHDKLTDNSNPADTETKSDKTLRTALFKVASIAVGASAVISLIISLIAK